MDDLYFLLQQAQAEKEQSVALRTKTLQLMMERSLICQELGFLQEITTTALAGSLSLLQKSPRK
jgi:hypothetical protein